MTAFGDIHAMASLLGGGDPDDTEAPYAGSARPTASFAPSALPVMRDDGVPRPRGARPGGDARAIWTDEELVDDFDLDDDAETGGDGDGADGGSIVPEFRFAYKQAVSTADAFLGMAHNKDPGTRAAVHLVLVVDLLRREDAARAGPGREAGSATAAERRVQTLGVFAARGGRRQRQSGVASKKRA